MWADGMSEVITQRGNELNESTYKNETAQRLS